MKGGEEWPPPPNERLGTMARDISIADALAALEAAGGIVLTEEQKNKVAEAARNEMLDASRTVVSNKLAHREDEASKAFNARVRDWADRFSALGRDFANDFPGQTVNRGQGQREIRMIRIETPQGSLKVELSSDADDSE